MVETSNVSLCVKHSPSLLQPTVFRCVIVTVLPRRTVPRVSMTLLLLSRTPSEDISESTLKFNENKLLTLGPL